MAGNLQQRLERLTGKAQLITHRYANLLEEKRAADATIAQLKESLDKEQRENNLLRQKIEHLQVVTTIAHNREDVEKTRAFLADLVRDIDKCIKELSE